MQLAGLASDVSFSCYRSQSTEQETNDFFLPHTAVRTAGGNMNQGSGVCKDGGGSAYRWVNHEPSGDKSHVRLSGSRALEGDGGTVHTDMNILSGAGCRVAHNSYTQCICNFHVWTDAYTQQSGTRRELVVLISVCPLADHSAHPIFIREVYVFCPRDRSINLYGAGEVERW